jgi:hypothetical protein
LQSLYDRIDIVAQQIVAEAKGRGHAAAPLHRFKLEPLRQKRPPVDVETWMLVDGIMPDESSLPVPKRVKIGRPKGRKNKVNDPGCVSEDTVERAESGRAKKRKRNTGFTAGVDSQSHAAGEGFIADLKDNARKRVEQAISSGLSDATRPSNTPELDQTLHTIALTSHEESLIDPDIDLVGHTTPKATREVDTNGSPVMTMVGLRMMDDSAHQLHDDSAEQDIHSEDETTYPDDWPSETLNDSRVLEQEVERGDAAANLQDYLSRLSNDVE